METQFSSISTKGQATIPASIRKHLNLKPGDKIAFALNKNGVILKKIEEFDPAYLKYLDKMFADWSDPGDTIYDNL